MNIKALADNLEMETWEFLDLLGFFVEQFGLDLEKLESSFKSGAVRDVIEASHSIKGAAGNLGLMEIYEIAKDIEDNGRDNNLDCEDTVLALKEAFDILKKSFKEVNVERL